MRRLLYTLVFLFATLQTYAQTYTYDSNNRLTKVVYDNGTTVTYTFDALGNRTSKKVTGSTATKYTISVSVTPSGCGSVTGGGTYTSGTSVELKAIPNADYKFLKWSDGSTANPRTITVTGDLSFTAQFEESQSSQSEESQSSLLGDVDGDGYVTMADVYSIVDFIMGKNPSPFDENKADVNQDDKVDAADVVEIVDIIKNNTTKNGDDGDCYNDVEPDDPILDDNLDIDF